MDKTTHSDKTIIITYIIMGFAFAGKMHASFREMLLSAFACLFEGIIMTQFPRHKLNGYIRRFASTLVCSVIIVFTIKALSLPFGYMPVILYMVLPAAAGALTVDGLCSIPEGTARTKLKTAMLNFACLAGGVTVALIITGAGYVR